jgi:hypothetical protein
MYNVRGMSIHELHSVNFHSSRRKGVGSIVRPIFDRRLCPFALILATAQCGGNPRLPK